MMTTRSCGRSRSSSTRTNVAGFASCGGRSSRGGAGVRPAIKIALQRQMEEATVRLATALREVGTMSLAEKYDITHTWEEPCSGCGEPVTMTAAKSEVLGPYYEGCFGWPACVCEVAHQGECSESGHS